MALLARKPLPATAHPGLAPGATLPELGQNEYYDEVLQLNTDNFDVYLEGLITKAKDLGIPVSRPSSTTDKRNTSGAESSITLDTSHARTLSTGSAGSANTMLTAYSSRDGNRESTGPALSRKGSRSLTFSFYDTYLTQVGPTLDQPKTDSQPSAKPDVAQSVLSSGTRKSFVSFRRGFTRIRRKRSTMVSLESKFVSCSACRDDLEPGESLIKLPCGHSYCPNCLRIMIKQATTEESKMPPRCCTQPVASGTIKTILGREDQTSFLKSVQQFSTPWESRVFCSNPSCGEFIPARSKIDPKHPFQAVCRKCRTRVCITCKRDAHPIGKDCPDDKELEAVLKMGEKSGWRRCYKCRTLVELTQGCTHMTCRCRAQFCYICGAVWDPTIGCPNVCNGDEEMERRRQEEDARVAAQEAEEALKEEAEIRESVESAKADERSRNAPEFQILCSTQAKELDRFQTFERKSKWLMWTRHAQQKLALTEKHAGIIEKMKDRHTKTSANLEDRQVAAEMELRSTLEQSEKNVRVRLKHMEAYCEGLGQKPNSDMPTRVVTERDLRELGQQYTLEKNMKQLHEAKINVMRDRQSKALEDLLERQEKEFDRLTEKNSREVESLESTFTDEEDRLALTFSERKIILEQRWNLCIEIMRRELEREHGLRYGPAELPEWPEEIESPAPSRPVDQRSEGRAELDIDTIPEI